MSNSFKNNTIVYCHGLPGSSKEIYFLPAEGTRPSTIVGPQHVTDFIESISTDSNQNMHIIGFSLGAMAAIKIAESNADAVRKLSLISPAAPLELGEFLPVMAGRLVFHTATRSALQFRILTALQNIGVYLSSDRIIRTIFAESPHPDIALLSDPKFKDSLLTGIKQSYGENNIAYRQAIREYVQPWRHRLANISCAVEIHHGTADNWAPLAMAYALKKELHADAKVIEYAGLGHFSTLREALPLLMTN